MKQFDIEANGVNVTICAERASLHYKSDDTVAEGERYFLSAEAANCESLRVLLSEAEAEGSETRLRVENVLNRADKLWQGWMATKE